MSQSRGVDKVVVGQPTNDGAGVKLVRVLTQELQRRLDPFLMLDAFRSDDPNDYIDGFPEHPHRGFETVTYMLNGRMRHRDSRGNEGLLEPGGVQWMTAGRGILHSEMPEQQDGLMEGFQLWVNLPAERKMIEPAYQDLTAAQVPESVLSGGVTVRAIAGKFKLIANDDQAVELTGAVLRQDTEPVFTDLHLANQGLLSLTLPPAHHAFVYVYRGEMSIGAPAKLVRAGQMAVLGNEAGADHVRLQAAAASRAIVVAGAPLNEPIEQYGPFVMNTREELHQAVKDLQAGRLG